MQHQVGTIPSPFPVLKAALFCPEKKVLNLVIEACGTVGSYLKANKYHCHKTAVVMVYRAIEMAEVAIENWDITSREPNLNFCFLVNKDVRTGCNIKILLPCQTEVNQGRGISRINDSNPWNMPDHMIHHPGNIPKYVDFRSYKPQVKSATYTQLVINAIIFIFRFNPYTLPDLWASEDWGGLWMGIFSNYGMLHKLMFPWANYFIEMMRFAKTGQVTKQLAYDVLLGHNLVPGPEVGIPPSHKDWHHNGHFQRDSVAFFDYYSATIDSNAALLMDAKNSDSNW